MEEKLVKEDKLCHFWAESRLGTGTKKGWYGYQDAEAEWYRYQSKWYWYHSLEPKWYRYQDNVVPVPTCRTRLVSVLTQMVPVPLLPTALIFCILTLLSSNSHTESIGTLLND